MCCYVSLRLDLCVQEVQNPSVQVIPSLELQASRVRGPLFRAANPRAPHYPVRVTGARLLGLHRVTLGQQLSNLNR